MTYSSLLMGVACPVAILFSLINPSSAGHIYGVSSAYVHNSIPALQVVEVDLKSGGTKVLGQPFVADSINSVTEGLSCLYEPSQTYYWTDGTGDIFAFQPSNRSILTTLKTGFTTISAMACDQATGDIWIAWSETNATSSTSNSGNSGLSQFSSTYAIGLVIRFPDIAVGAQAMTLDGTQLFFIATTVRNMSQPTSYIWTFDSQTGAQLSAYPLSCPEMLLTYTAIATSTTLRGLGFSFPYSPSSSTTASAFSNVAYEIEVTTGSCQSTLLDYGTMFGGISYDPTEQELYMALGESAGLVIYSYVSGTNTTLPLKGNPELLNMAFTPK